MQFPAARMPIVHSPGNVRKKKNSNIILFTQKLANCIGTQLVTQLKSIYRCVILLTAADGLGSFIKLYLRHFKKQGVIRKRKKKKEEKTYGVAFSSVIVTSCTHYGVMIHLQD